MKRHTITSMAAVLRMSPTTLRSYLGMKGAPKEGRSGWDLEVVSKFVSQKSKTVAVGAKSNPEMAELKIRELQLRCDRLAFKLETERGLHIAKATIGPTLRNATQHFRAE